MTGKDLHTWLVDLKREGHGLQPSATVAAIGWERMTDAERAAWDQLAAGILAECAQAGLS